MKSPMTRAALGLALVISAPSSLYAAELTVLVATPLAEATKELASQFERQSQHTVRMQFMSGPVIKERIDAGAMFDVAISITPVIDALVKQNKADGSSRVPVAYAGVGVGVRSGAPKPKITSVEDLKSALLSAKSVAHSATGVSGDHFKAMLGKLGIEDQMRPKLKPMAADVIAKAVPSGEAEMIIVTTSVIMNPGMDLVGPLPAELQFYNSFAAAVSNASTNKDAAKAFVGLIVSPNAKPVLEKHGLQPGSP